jgi:hypothetical protein
MNWAVELAVSNSRMVDPVQHPYNPTLALSPTQMLSQASLGEWKNKPLLKFFALAPQNFHLVAIPTLLEKCVALLNAIHVL